MTELDKAMEAITSVAGLSARLDGVLEGAIHARNATFNEMAKWEKKPTLIAGVNDPRLCVFSLSEVHRGLPREKGDYIPVGVSSELRIETMLDEWGSIWAYGGAYDGIKDILKEEVPDLSEEQVMRVLMKYVPHTIRVVTVVWYEGFVLMQLASPGTKAKPASAIHFPQGRMLGHDDSLDSASVKIANSPFMPFTKPDWKVEMAESWSLMTPNRPEIVLVRHAEFKGNPSLFYGTWVEEQYYPYVWVQAEAVTDAASGDTAELVRGVRIMDKQYRSKARNLITEIDILESCKGCGSTLRSGSHKVPVKSSLQVKNSLKLDDVSSEIASTLEIASLSCAI